MPLLEAGKCASVEVSGLEINLLHTGIGMVNTAWHLGKVLPGRLAPELALQFGIAGAFPSGPDLLEVVELHQDCFAELGAESPEGFIPLQEMGFSNFDLHGESVYNIVRQPRPALPGKRQCKAITVSRVSGKADSIAAMEQIWSPEVETMEGAAFFQACLMEGIPFRALRTISNRVEPRNRAAWKMKEAIEVMQSELLFLLKQLQNGELTL